VVSFPCLARTTSGLGEVRYALGDRMVDRYLEFLAGRARPNMLRAVAFDLNTFFTVIAKDPGPGGRVRALRGMTPGPGQSWMLHSPWL
jgi:hypothetical protein